MGAAAVVVADFVVGFVDVAAAVDVVGVFGAAVGEADAEMMEPHARPLQLSSVWSST